MMGKEKQFTFDQVFGQASHQHEIYERNVSILVKSLFEGYNATVLAYGQTGSGKTYTMGTSTDSLVDDDDSKLGVIPRAMSEIFEIIEDKKAANPGAEFYLRVQFLEIYGEDIRDLLDPAGSSEGKVVSIRETDKGLEIVGAVEEAVKSTQSMYEALERGSLCRTTGSTEMNLHSSRSHAIFTIIVEQHLPVAVDSSAAAASTSATNSDEDGQQNAGEQHNAGAEGEPSSATSSSTSSSSEDLEYRIAKFHFVDLAGSERAKRTGATGTRLKEGININKGLLALGNVISALGDETKPKGTHVPYRDSKLTRMLQDSLGGNSRTLMIACVSPADANFEETLNALRYANRARNIKNKPIVNRDPNSSQIAMLKAQIQQLKLQLSGNGQNGELPAGMDFASFSGNAAGGFDWMGGASGADTGQVRQELDAALSRASCAESEIQRLNEVLEREKRSRSDVQEKYIMAAAQVDFYKSKFGGEGEAKDIEMDDEAIQSNANYLRKIEELQRQLETSDWQLSQARKELKVLQSEFTFADSLDEVEKEIVRNSRLRRSLEGFHRPSSSGAGASNGALGGGFDDLDEEDEGDEDNDGDEDDSMPGLVAMEDIDADSSLVEVNDDDDEMTRELKEKFHKTQESYRSMVQSYDVTLRSKQMIMKKVVEERKKFEAMKAHYEAKMAEMNAEVQVTQQQRDALDAKIKELESSNSKSSSDAVRTQITKLRIQLKDKMERLKNLEKESKQLADAKRMANKWQVKEQKIQREIDSMKKQKVEYQRRMEENAKKYREEAQQRKQEIARLRKQQRVLAQDKQKLQMRNTRDERLLRQKTEQVTAMQRKLRQAQRLTSFNKQLTEKERKQRKLLDKWARERIKHDEEVERLHHSLAKKQAAIERKEQLCRELEERKRSAEQRAKIAEENVAQALTSSHGIAADRQTSRSITVGSGSDASPAQPPAAPAVKEKQCLSSFFVSPKSGTPSTGLTSVSNSAHSTPVAAASASFSREGAAAIATPPSSSTAAAASALSASASLTSSNAQGTSKPKTELTVNVKMTPEELEAMEELEQRLEAAEYEIIFHKKQCEAAAAKISADDEEDEDEEQEVAEVDDGEDMRRNKQLSENNDNTRSPTSKSIAAMFPVELNSLEEAKSVFQELLQMYVDAKRSKSQLKQTIERLKQQAYMDESRTRRDLQRRKSLLPSMPGNGGTSPASSIAGTPNLSRHSIGHPGSPMAAVNGTPATARVLQDKLGESSELCNVLLKENQRLLALIKKHGISADTGVEENMNEAKLRALEEQVRQLQVSGTSSAFFSGPRSLDSARRSSLGPNIAFSNMVSTPQQSEAVRRAAERAQTLAEEQQALGAINTAGTSFNNNASFNSKSSSGSAYSSAADFASNPLVQAFQPHARTPGVFDRLTNAENFTGIHKRKIIDQQTRLGDAVEKTLDELVVKPFTELEVDSLQLTDAHPESTVDGLTLNPAALAEIQRKNARGGSPRSTGKSASSPRASRRSSTGSDSNSPSFTRMTESYSNRRAQESKLRANRTRDSTGSMCSTTSGPHVKEIKTENGTYKSEVGGLYRNNESGRPERAHARQLAWESQKRSGQKGDATDSGSTSSMQRSGSPGTPDDNPEKENSSDEIITAGSAFAMSVTAKPIHERLADPKYYTGVQKQKALESDASAPTSTNTTGQVTTAAQLRKKLAQERARRKKVPQ